MTLNRHVSYYCIEDSLVNADTAYIVLDIDIFGVRGVGGRIIFDSRFMIFDF